MNRGELVSRVRSYTRDTTGTLFSVEDVQNFINEGIDRLRQITELVEMDTLSSNEDVPDLLPPQYHYCLAVYGACRCFSQDEQHYLAQTFADEFNGIFDLIELGIKQGTIVIVRQDGTPIKDDANLDSVVNVYFRV